MRKRYLIVCGLILAVVSACATSPSGSAPTGDPEKLVNQLGMDLDTARKNRTDMLAPEWYQKAKEYHEKAMNALKAEKKMSDIRQYVSEGNNSLKKAEEFAKVSGTVLQKTNQSREKALEVGAEKLGKPFLDVEEQYLKLTRAIENNNLSYAQKNAERVQSGFQKLEIMAIKNNALGPARKIMEQAKKEKAWKLVPTVYSEAEKSLNEADSFIEKNPYENEMIKEKADFALFMAQRMISVKSTSKKMDAMSSESSALYAEHLLSRLSNTIGSGDIRDRSPEEQISILSDSVSELKSANEKLSVENQNNQTQITSLEDNLNRLRGFSMQQEEVKNKLAVEREFNERFDKVQQYFDPEEAEVYKQGGKLIIRMRGISFPVGGATLTKENYSLLSKVQKSIQMFEKPMVVIEGHTDSTGSYEKNQLLSKMRAEAVEEYLIANNTLSSDKIQSVGYGPDRPLASNTTKEGRAINRRIDVLITPTQLQ